MSETLIYEQLLPFKFNNYNIDTNRSRNEQQNQTDDWKYSICTQQYRFKRRQKMRHEVRSTQQFWRNMTIPIILQCICMSFQSIRCQEPLTQWMKGRASHYGTSGNAMIIPKGSCGFVENLPSWDNFPYGQIASLSLFSNISAQHSMQGCGACIEIICAGEMCQSQSTISKIVNIYDLCSSQTYQVQCDSDELVLPYYIFQQFTTQQVDQIDIEYRQIECNPQINITMIVEDYLRGYASYISLKFRDIAGDGSITSAELRQTPQEEQMLNSDWLQMTRFGQTSFDFSGVPDPPLDLRITGAGGQVAILRAIIGSDTTVGEYDTKAQFQTGALLTKIPVIRDFPNVQAPSIGCICEDKIPQGVPNYSCEEEKQYGRCQAAYMTEQDWCAKTCGRCSCDTEPVESAPYIPTDPYENIPSALQAPVPAFGLQEDYTTIIQQQQQPQQQQEQAQQVNQQQDTQQSALQNPPLLAIEFPEGVQKKLLCPLSLEGLVSGAPDLKLFYEAVVASDLASKMQNPYLSMTLFAPNNYAFELLMDQIGLDWETFKSVYPGLLQRILLYHMIPGIWDVQRLAASGHNNLNPLQILTLLPRSSVDIIAETETTLVFDGPINSGKTIWSDLSICESIVHYVDAVVLPFTDYSLTQLFKFEQIQELPLDVNITLPPTTEPSMYVLAESLAEDQSDDSYTEFNADTMNEVIKPELPPVSSVVVQTYPQDSTTNMTTFVVGQQNPQLIETVYQYTTNPAQLMQQYYEGDTYNDLGFSDLTQVCPSTYQLIQRNPELSVLQQLIVAAQYDEILNDVQRKFTVFAPTDEAFQQLLAQENTTLSVLVQRPSELKILLGYHIISGLYSIDELRILSQTPNNYLNTFIQYNQQTVQLELQLNLLGEIVIIGEGSNATQDRQIRSCQSVVHIIDTVLLPFEQPAENTIDQQSAPVQNRPPMSQPILQYDLYNTAQDMQNQTKVSQQSQSIYQPEQGSAYTVSTQILSPVEDEAQSPQIVQREGQIIAPLGIIQPTEPAFQCQNIQAFFGSREDGEPDLRYFQILVQISQFQDSLFYTRDKISLFVPTNEGFDSSLQIVNATFSKLLLDPEAVNNLVKYHIVNGETELEELASSQGIQTISIPTGLEGQTLQLQPDDFTSDGELSSITSFITRAKVLQRVQTCQGIIYVIDSLLLPQGFDLNR
eukprot:TRINITY_DN4153_c0_g2_i1.p1 TRINITY_DN4153_c0_g2~~TRINITY_DN4153_c0_g2_i1.p1  ORF type:complete len:1180 (-),score=74.75 TRINITY_DN4153_c0_g2_i1:343-3882(-)